MIFAIFLHSNIKHTPTRAFDFVYGFWFFGVTCILGYVLDGLPTVSTVHLKVEQQIELIRSWNLQPDFIINIKVVLDFCHFFILVELFSLRSFVYWLPNYAHVGLCQSRKI